MKLTTSTRSLITAGALAGCIFLVSCTSSSDDTNGSSATTSQPSQTSQTSQTTSAPVEASTSTPVDASTDAAEASTTVLDEDRQVAVACGAAFRITFDEGAPRDRMVIDNDSTAPVELASVSIDLGTSAGRIIFDTTEGGEGVEVFQDFQVEGGDAALVAAPTAVDGGTTLELAFSSFAPGQSFTFSIDVDDQLVDSDLGQIQVTGAEIQGTVVDFTIVDSPPLTAVFGADNTASTTSADSDQRCAS